jgi:hypothetical protein
MIEIAYVRLTIWNEFILMRVFKDFISVVRAGSAHGCYVFMYVCMNVDIDMICTAAAAGFEDLVDCNVLRFGSVEAMMEITSLVPQVRNKLILHLVENSCHSLELL